ncbi:NAD(P)H-binding protein [Altericroceibacterium endophyticum]|uniref:NAD(P)H-binding protein n=1 Tax=Altericroceibacterium endophyticum TaxID=1808508 RepID=A0A6I4T2B4_9SPHN|nr:NAD(P)H-binding protein [Altericroceibacterium endophyticum]MXO64243.1 NAD(P)H-binding protein [Altericroceibacterium endophyticum]
MSDRRRVLLIGATGLIGQSVLRHLPLYPNVSLKALARREVPLPRGAPLEMLIADPSGWEDAIADYAPQGVICALGTTWSKAGKDEAAFRAVDHDLVVSAARAAKSAGADQFTVISSVGADAASGNFYLRTKGETEDALAKIGFRRLDIFRPSLLKGPRGQDRRKFERLGIMLSPLTALFLHGAQRRLRAVPAERVASAALATMGQAQAGRFVHEYDDISKLANHTENHR